MIDLRALRAAAALTQAQVAERLGVTTGRVSQIEGGANLTLASLGDYLAALADDKGEGPMYDPALGAMFDRLTKAVDLIGEAMCLTDPQKFTGSATWTLHLDLVDGSTEDLSAADASTVAAAGTKR